MDNYIILERNDGKMASGEKQALVLTFYNLIDSTKMEIEANLDSWLKGNGTDEIHKNLLGIAQLATQLLWDELYAKPAP